MTLSDSQETIEKQDTTFSKLSERKVCVKIGRDLTYEMQGVDSPRVIGRDEEINQALALLSRSGMQNLVLTGDPGIGKTVLVEEIARRISLGQVPRRLQKRRIIQTSFADVWAYVANSENWGKYLETLKQLIEECKDENAILFMDEIHTMFSHFYSMQYIRPYLSDGSLTIIGATTDQEYFTYMSRDLATARRFQILHFDETDETATLEIIKKKLPEIEEIYEFTMPENLLPFLISLSNAYMPFLFQPSKTLNILDQIGTIKSLSGEPSPINKDDIRLAISQAIGIPVEAISSPRKRLVVMEEILNTHILGQEKVIHELCRKLFISKAGMSVSPERPDGVFLLAGPTGVGKTELAKALARYMNGNEKDLIRIDMSAYADYGSIDKLLGVPGRKTVDESPQTVPLLTQQLRTRPYSVLLLDEIEKAHKSIHLLFLHAFDSGRMIDNLGNEIYFGNTIIIMTTNLGFSVRQPVIGMLGKGSKNLDAEYEGTALKVIKEAFPSEFLGRIDRILFFNQLTKEIMRGFVKQKIAKLKRITGKKILISDSAIEFLCEKGFDPEYGARDLNRAVDDLLGYKLACFKFMVDWDGVEVLQVSKDAVNDELNINRHDGKNLSAEADSAAGA